MVGRLTRTAVAATLTVAAALTGIAVSPLRATDLATQPLPTQTNGPAEPALSTTLTPADAAEITSRLADLPSETGTEPETVDPVAVASIAPNSFANPAPAVLKVVDAGGEFGPEYEISVRNADSFLDRLSARLKGLVEAAMSYLGTPYRRGGSSRKGVDCSGLVGAVYGQQGVDMPRTAAEQFNRGISVEQSDLLPGDLVFFRDTYKHGISHVGIFVGDGHFVHAAGHHQGVIVSDLSASYYHLRFAGARRMPARPDDVATSARRAGLTPSAAATTASNALGTTAAVSAVSTAPDFATARPAGF
jgi:cell wall-associated NlpC family hydrolase